MPRSCDTEKIDVKMRLKVLWIVVSAVAIFAAACGSKPVPAESESVQVGSPTWEELEGATYRGLTMVKDSVTLIDGKWSRDRYRVRLNDRYRLVADLAGLSSEESAVILAETGPDSGEILSIAIVARKNGKLENLATAPIGDRVQIYDARLDGKYIVLEVVQAGPKDAACCPGEVRTRRWVMRDGVFAEDVGTDAAPRRLGLDMIGRKQWFLHSWKFDEKAGSEPRITLAYQDGRFTGSSGCNRYFAGVKAGASPGDIRIGGVGGTKMACAPGVLGRENRFLKQLTGVYKISFLMGRLALAYGDPGSADVMLFEEVSN